MSRLVHGGCFCHGTFTCLPRMPSVRVSQSASALPFSPRLTVSSSEGLLGNLPPYSALPFVLALPATRCAASVPSPPSRGSISSPIFPRSGLMPRSPQGLANTWTPKHCWALISVVPWVGHRLERQRVPGLIPSQDTYLGWGLVPGWGMCERQLIHVSLPSLNLKLNK